MGRLDGKVAWISGGASGMGLAAVELFAAEGCKIVIADINDADGRALADRLGDSVRYTHCDITDEQAIVASIGLAETAFGGLDIVFNNAGIANSGTPVDRLDADRWDLGFAILLRAQMLAIKHAVPLMRKRGGGAVVNNASGAAVMPFGTGSEYGAAKAGVVQLTRVLAAELGPDLIRVNAILPGWIPTPMLVARRNVPREVAVRMTQFVGEGFAKLQPLAKAGDARFIAEAALFLAGPESSWITGAALPVDGGLLVRNQSDPQLDGIITEALRQAQES